MQLTTLQPNLKAAIAAVSRAVAGKSTLPVLSNILLTAKDGALMLAATNLDIGITVRVSAQVFEDGATTVPAKLLADVVASLPNDAVVMTLDSRTQTLNIKGGRATSNIRGIDADEFPTIPSAAGARPYVTLKAAVFASAAAQVAYAAATDDSRPVLAGIRLAVSPTGGEITMAAADGFRLAKRRAGLAPLAESDLPPLIVPARALVEAAALAGGVEDDITLSITPGWSQLIVTANAATLVSRLIDGQFPDYERIIPTGYAARAVVDVAKLKSAVRLASYFASSSQNLLKVVLEPGDPGRIVVSVNAAEVGDSVGEVEALVSGQELPIALNAKYLADALAAIPTAQVAVELTSSAAPAMLKPIGLDGESIQLVMPMSLR